MSDERRVMKDTGNSLLKRLGFSGEIIAARVSLVVVSVVLLLVKCELAGGSQPLELLLQQLSFSPLHLLYGLAIASVTLCFVQVCVYIANRLTPSALDEYLDVQHNREVDAETAETTEPVESTVVATVVIALLVGFGEELLFRGLLQPTFGLLIASVSFGFLHFASVRTWKASLFHAAVASGLGLLLGASVIYFENLWPAIAAHAAHNIWSKHPWDKPLFLHQDAEHGSGST
jgi:membrane protease YdiL (CAAX protease family)